LRERPDDGFAMTQLSWVYLALERDADALRMAHQAAEWLPIEKDAFGGPSFAVGLAQVQARTGEAPEAVKTLRHLLSIPAGIAVSVNRLKIDPVWDPIRSDPEFQQLLAGKEEVGGYPGYGQLKPSDPRFEKVLASHAPLAEPFQKYTGILTHGEFISCGGQVINPPPYSVGGTWIFYLDPIDPMATDKAPPPAHITINVLRDGSPYVMFDYLNLEPISAVDGVYTYGAIGDDVKVTFDTRANTTPAMFFWAVQFYDNCTQRSYRSLTYVGRAD
jgi:hypothetical protein